MTLNLDPANMTLLDYLYIRLAHGDDAHRRWLKEHLAKAIIEWAVANPDARGPRI